MFQRLPHALRLLAVALPLLASQARAADAPVYAIVHVDIAPSQVEQAIPLLRSFAEHARHDPAVLDLQVLQQTGADNHYTLVEVLRSPADYRHFVETDYAKALRTGLQPLLGSPFDERLHSRLAGSQP
ncbi:MAG: hypothetical protein GAK45_00684 [Pseudomonas citronellolis]|nr:MAG: hypothetical protein GAK45_00684 [Pseudomonas citronellolis]